MPEDQKSSFSEAVETGASAAHTIRGAIKTGKAISSAAKGAAAGGPYGAVAGAVWAGRKHIGKIIVAVIALLMLPVLFVLMLPGLIFGGLTNAFSPSDPEIPILNSETAIIENANEITFTLNGILGEALDDVLARIEADFAASGADHMEVKNAYSGGPIYNANLFISQYCAAKDKDFESISLNDLAATLRENKQHLYSYTSKQEIRESTVTDPETGEETTVSETWMVYTVRYNGESYFSDVVFQLTDDQKELAADYASNLSLFLGDGLLQNLEAWTGNSITSLGDVTFTDGITPVVYYNQLDERYAGKAYGTDNIGGYGCGPTAMAIVVSSLTDDMVDPVEMAEWSYNNGYWCKSSGSYHALIPAAAGEWGLPVSGCTTAEPQRITDALASSALMKWRYKSEMRVKALIWSVICQQRLAPQFRHEDVHGLILGNSMDLAYQILTSTGGRKHDFFMLDGSYEHFLYLTNNHQGEVILALLCDPVKTAELDRILLQGLTARQPGLAIEHDGVSPDGSPVLFGYFCDLPRIARFNTSLELSERPGTLICFDFQAEVLRSYCGSRVRFQTIDFTKFEGRLFP